MDDNYKYKTSFFSPYKASGNGACGDIPTAIVESERALRHDLRLTPFLPWAKDNPHYDVGPVLFPRSAEQTGDPRDFSDRGVPRPAAT